MRSFSNRFSFATVGVSCLTSAAAAQYAVTTRVNVDPGGVEANGPCWAGKITPDARFVTFTGFASSLVQVPHLNGQAYLVDRQTQQVELVSQSNAGAPGEYASNPPSISADGRYVAFYSQSSNLVANDTNATFDVFVRDRQAGTTTRVSVDSNGAQGDAGSAWPCISDNGRSIAFQSSASNLVSGDSNGTGDVFFKNLVTGHVRRINESSTGAQANGNALFVSASSDVRWVAYYETATNLVNGDTNGVGDVFVTNTSTGATQRVSVSSSGAQSDQPGSDPVISRDGTVVAFTSASSMLVPGDINGFADVFVHELATGTTELASLRDGGVQLAGESLSPQLSSDGRYVAFMSYAANVLSGDSNNDRDAFVFDRVARRVTCASLSWSGAFTQAGVETLHYVTSISGDGRYALIHSKAANIVQGDFNQASDVFVRDWLGSVGPVAFCTAVASAGGCTPQIAASANPSATLATPCQLSVSLIDAQRSGLFFYGVDNTGFAPAPWLGGPSWLCVRAPTQRTPVQSSAGTAGQCDGTFQLDWNQFQQTHAGALGAPWLLGQHIYVQAWFRDPASNATTALTSALELTAQP